MRSFLSFSGYGGVELPVEVRRLDMTLVRRALTSDALDLEPGDYVVLARFPDGQYAYRRVRAAQGQEQRISFHDAPREPMSAPAAQRARSRTLTLHIERSANAAAIRLPDKDATRAQHRETHIACYAGNPLQGTCRVLRPETVGEVSPRRRKERQMAYRLSRRGETRQLILQVAQAGAAGVHLILPHDALKVQVWLHPTEPPQLHAHLPNKALDTALQFLWHGDGETAAQLALHHIASKPDLPRLVYLYALLRTNALQQLGEWTEQLTSPQYGADGAVIRSECYARQGNPQDSLRELLRLSSLGLPVFTEGFTLAINRLRLSIAASEGFPPEQREEAAALLQALSAFEPCVDYTQPFLTYTGRRPDAPAEP
ncbi:MAG: hypothetical protein ACK4ME_05665 [Fimbriimonadales bacterium]